MKYQFILGPILVISFILGTYEILYHTYHLCLIWNINKNLPQWLSGEESSFSAGDAGDRGSLDLTHVAQETWVQSLGQEDPLEEEMATHSNILAWRIPWTEEPGGLQSTGLQLSHWAHTHTHTWKKDRRVTFPYPEEKHYYQREVGEWQSHKGLLCHGVSVRRQE